MIDIHTHLAVYEYFPKYFIDGIVDSIFFSMSKEEQTRESRAMIEFMARKILSDKEGSKQIKQQEKAGIDKSVLLIVDFFYGKEDNQELLEKIFEGYSKVQKANPEKFVVFAGIDPRRRRGMDLLEKSIAEYEFKGLKLYPPCGFELDAKELMPYYAYCQEKNIPVLTHTGPSLGNMKCSNRFVESVENVVKQFGNLKLILAHAGIRYCEESILLGKYENVYIDISGFQKEIQNRKLIAYKFKQLFSQIPEKVLFGTDWPLFNLNTAQSKWVDYFNESCELSEKHKEMLFHRNAANVLEI